MPKNEATPALKPSRQYWLIPLQFAWDHFSLHHRQTLCIYAGLSPECGRFDWRGLGASDHRKIHTAFLRQYGVITDDKSGTG